MKRKKDHNMAIHEIEKERILWVERLRERERTSLYYMMDVLNTLSSEGEDDVSLDALRWKLVELAKEFEGEQRETVLLVGLNGGLAASVRRAVLRGWVKSTSGSGLVLTESGKHQLDSDEATQLLGEISVHA